MKHVLMLALLAGISTVGLAGCGEEAKVQETTKVEGPGGTTEVNKETKIKQTGDNPPPAPAEAK